MTTRDEADRRPAERTRLASAWGDRDFSLLWGGAAMSQLGSISASTAAPLLALTLTRSPVFAGWVTAASTVPSLLLHVPAGVIVDRWNRRSIMLASQSVRLTTTVTLVAGLALLDSHTALRALLLITAAMDGTCTVLYNAAEITALQQVVKPEFRSDALAKNEARRHIALLLGRPLGGTFFGLNRTIPYLFDALTCLISIFTIRKISSTDFRSENHPPPTRIRPVSGVVEGIRYIVRDPVLRTVLGVCTITNFFFQTMVLLLVVSAKDSGMSSSRIGLLLASSGLGGLLGTIVAPQVVNRLKPSLVVAACVWSWLPLALVIVVFDDPTVGLLAWGSLSFMGAHLNVALAVRQMGVPESLLGRVASINGFFTSGAVSLGAFVAGYTISGLSTRGAAELVAWVLGGMVIAAPISLLLGSEPLRDLTGSLAERREHPSGAEGREQQQGATQPFETGHAINV